MGTGSRVPYEHVIAPCEINIGSDRAFNPGDVVPIDTAKDLGLLKRYPKLERIVPEPPPDVLVTFTDAELPGTKPASTSTSSATQPTPAS